MQRLFSYRSDAAMRSRLGSKQLSALAESVSSDPFAKVGQPANAAATDSTILLSRSKEYMCDEILTVCDL